MSNDNMGKPLKVKDRWHGDHKCCERRELKSREFKDTQQFTLDDIYITLFTHFRYSENGRVTYVPVERNLQSMGIRVMDEFLRSLSASRADVAAFCQRYGIHISDIN